MAIYVKHNNDFEEAEPGVLVCPHCGEDRVVMSANLVELDRNRDDFPYSYLPQHSQRLLREAFGCYAADLFLAFAILCRRTIDASRAATADANDHTFETLFDDAATLSGIEADTSSTLKAVLFGAGDEPEITADEAAALIEIVKDIFHQRYVRTAKLRRAIKMRRFFAHEAQHERGRQEADRPQRQRKPEG